MKTISNKYKIDDLVYCDLRGPEITSCILEGRFINCFGIVKNVMLESRFNDIIPVITVYFFKHKEFCKFQERSPMDKSTVVLSS
jgi:hypothetical protein